MNKRQDQKPALPYRILKAYIRFYHDKVCYRKTYTLGQENIPDGQVPLLIVSNHQNGVSDPLGIVMSFRDRKVNVIARADAFAIHPIANVFLRAIGLLPAFRIDHEGEAALSNNDGTFKMSEQALLNGETVVMYPESGHQNKRWLGTFSYGYTKMAFEAAEMGNFEKEVFILPSANHYDDYFGIRNTLVIRFGTPISLKPYYDLYKTKPRTAQRQVNALVRSQIKSMMLNIEDLDHYDAIDYLRSSAFGIQYAVSHGYDPKVLPQKLASDKALDAALEAVLKAASEPALESAGKPPVQEATREVSKVTAPDDAKESAQEAAREVGRLLEQAEDIRSSIERMHIRDDHFDKTPCVAGVVVRSLAALALLPLWLVCLWPGVLMVAVAKYLSIVRMKDRMMESTFLICLSILIWIPIFSILTFVLAGIFINWWVAAAWVLLFPAIFIFGWGYAKATRRLFQDISFLSRRRGSEVARLKELRNNLFNNLKSYAK